jgi:hypothetical protein
VYLPLNRVHKEAYVLQNIIWRHIIEGSGKRAFLFYRGSIRGTERYLAREGSANMFIGPQPVLDIFFCYV